MQILTKREIAARYRVSIRTIDNWVGRILPSIKISGKILFDADECDRAIKTFSRRPRFAAKLPKGCGTDEEGQK